MRDLFHHIPWAKPLDIQRRDRISFFTVNSLVECSYGRQDTEDKEDANCKDVVFWLWPHITKIGEFTS